MNKYFLYFVSISAIALSFPLQATDWSTPINVSQNNLYADNPQICCDYLGTPIAVWRQYTSTTKDYFAIYGSIFKDGKWQKPDQISHEIYGPLVPTPPLPFFSSLWYSSQGPQICCDEPGHAIIIWVELDGQNKPVLKGTSYEPGSGVYPTDGDTISVNTDTFGISNQTLCCNSQGHAIVIWTQDFDPSGIKIYGAGYAPGQPSPVTGPDLITNFGPSGSPNGSPQICCDKQGHAIVVWPQFNDFPETNHYVIYGAGYMPGQAYPVTPPDIIAQTKDTYLFSPQICCDTPGHAIIVWDQNDHTNSTITGAEYSPGHVGTPIPISAPFPYSYGLSICCDIPGHAIVVWGQAYAEQPAQIWGAGFSPKSSQVTGPDKISNDTSFLLSPYVCCAAIEGKAVVDWVQSGTSNTLTIYGAEYLPGSSPKNQTQISDPFRINPHFPMPPVYPLPVIACCGSSAFALWSEFDLPGGIYSSAYSIEPLNYTLELQQSSVANLTQVTIIPVGGIRPYTILVNGQPREGNILNLVPGTYTISVKDSNEPPTTVSKTFSIPALSCPCAHKLVLANKYSNGAPVQSVSWSCKTDECPYNLIAVGGYKGSLPTELSSASLRIYSFNEATQQLTKFYAALPTDYVYSVDWCCINGIPYLTIAGCPDQYGNSVWIYKYDPYTNTMMFVKASNAQRSIIYSVKWLCTDCTTNPNIRNLAIGGEAYNGAEIRILQFDSSLETITQIGSAPFGATIFSLDWAKGTNNCNFLAAGGKKALDCNVNVNLRIYSVSCDGFMLLTSSTLTNSATIADQIVRSVEWRSQDIVPCSLLKYLAVGTDFVQGEPNVKLYSYDTRLEQLQEIASHVQPGQVLNVKWLPTCEQPLLSVASGCLIGDCVPNIYTYIVLRKQPCEFEFATVAKNFFNGDITSQSYCVLSNSIYKVVGAEIGWPRLNGPDPLCGCNQTHYQELGLFKSACIPINATCQPISICMRTKPLMTTDMPKSH